MAQIVALHVWFDKQDGDGKILEVFLDWDEENSFWYSDELGLSFPKIGTYLLSPEGDVVSTENYEGNFDVDTYVFVFPFALYPMLKQAFFLGISIQDFKQQYFMGLN